MPSVPARQATLRDIADTVGVSYQTVWRVVNDRPHVAEATRARVLKALRETDYRPHRAAQVLTTGKSYLIQLIVFEYGHNDRLPALLHWAREYGYSIVVSELEGPPSSEGLRSALRESSQMVDGVILVLPYAELTHDEMRDLCSDLPYVVVNTKMSSRMPSVVTDQWAGARSAMDYLLDLGHVRIAEVSGPAGHCDADMRHRAWQVFQQQRGLTANPALSVTAEYDVGAGYEGTKRLLSRDVPFTALYAGSDHIALGAMRAMREAGLRIPEDVSVVGFADIKEAAYLEPPLTTVRQDFEAVGKEAVEFLVSFIENPGMNVHQRVLYPELIIRESTKKLEASLTQV